MITTGTIFPEEVNGSKKALVVEVAAVTVTITETTQLLNIHFKEKRDSLNSKLIIIEPGHQITKYKKIIDTLPILCADKNYQGIPESS